MRNTRLLSSLRPFIYVAKIFGVFPFNFQVDDNIVKVTVSKLWILYGLCFSLLINAYWSLYISFHTEDVWDRINEIVFQVFLMLPVLSVWLFLYHSSTFKSVIEELFLYSDIINKKHFRLKIILITLTETFFHFIINSFSATLELPEFLKRFARLEVTIIAVLFSNVLLFLSFLFKQINCEISSLASVNTVGSCKNETVIEIEEKNELLHLIKRYNRVSSLCEKVNKCFEGYMVVLAFIVAIFSVVMIFQILTTSKENVIFLQIFTSIYALAEVWFILFSCESVLSEAHKTATIVHELMMETNDARVKEQFQQFSLQLIHTKIQFTAWGFFSLDYTLVPAMAGVITTYLIIGLTLPDGSKVEPNVKCQLKHLVDYSGSCARFSNCSLE